ncbi:hypothetical protein C8Q78DRAFT_993158 [Trametes maxima]|nr:hypothetical protein C8Q78DRAFT_993158 [Trametes maxima]
MAYLDSLRTLLPDDLRGHLDRARPEFGSTIEVILRLAVGAKAPDNHSVTDWDGLRARTVKAIDELKHGEHDGSSHKRGREDEPPASSKRARTDNADATPSIEQDPPLFTLHALSASSPIRKKVNITIHRSSIRLTNPSTKNEEYAPIPLAALQRAFLLSTRGKSKPHWTVALLATDTPAPTGKAAEATKDTVIVPQLVFGLDATLTTSFTTTTYDANGTPTTDSYPKGSASLPALRAFLSHIPTDTLEPSTTIFRSAAAPSGDGVAGVEAYRGAKQGTLWFLDEGVLWDGKPCEFFALEHLAPTGKSEQSFEGVRTLSATGRTCSVILRRIAARPANGKRFDGEESDDEEDEGEDTDFGMVDGREQETIGRWIKSHRHRFGRLVESGTGAEAAPAGGVADVKGKRKARAEDLRNEDTEDEEDSDFTMESSDDESSSDEGSESDVSADSGEIGEEDEAGDEDEEENLSDVPGDEAEEALDPKHHPLLRPGAMPRMSRAAVDAVVGMVEQDLMGGNKRGADADDESEEEDELDD